MQDALIDKSSKQFTGLSSRKSLQDYFKDNSDFLNLLEPLLLEIKWTGNRRHLIEALPHFADCLDLVNFRNVLARINYKSEAIKIDLRDIDHRLLPCIYLSEGNSAMLVKSIKEEKIHVLNGLTNQEEILENTSLQGTAYFFSVFKESESYSVGRNSWFSKTAEKFRSLTYQILFVSFVINVLSMVTPLFTMSIYDKVITAKSNSMLFEFSLGAIIVMTGSSLVSMMRSKILSYIGARLDKNVGEIIIQRLLYLPPSFTENATVGAQIARIKEFDSVREFFTSPLAANLFELPFSFIFIIAIWFLGGWLFLVPLVMVLIFLIAYKMIDPYIEQYNKKSAEASSKKQSFQIEALGNLREIKSIGAEEIWMERYEDLTAGSIYAGFKSSFITSILNSIADSLMLLSGLIVIVLGAIEVTNANMTVGSLIAVMMLTWKTLGPLKLFFSVIPRMGQVISNIKQVNALINLKIEKDLGKTINPISKQKGKIEFQRISFRYRNDVPPSLLGVSFIVQPGEIVCVAGRNGSGKSTLLKLIAGLYQPQAGSILIDNSNIHQLDPVELRHSMAYMPQNTKLFYGTIEQNLLFSNPIATKEDLEIATRLAGVYDQIMALPQGFQTAIKDQSALSLSASFQQCIALARSYTKRSMIMLFDEPTNTLDDESDADFMHVIELFRKQATIFIVTHRPAHLKAADRILYMEQGQLLFNGPPSEVLPRIPFDFL